MYSRSYFGEDTSVSVPENYVGNAFSENETQEKEDTENRRIHTNAQTKSEETSSDKSSESCEVFSSSFEKSPFKSMFSDGGIFSSIASKFKSLESGFHLGTEEVLLLGLAAYLFFSKEGDKECAIILLLLVFIS